MVSKIKIKIIMATTLFKQIHRIMGFNQENHISPAETLVQESNTIECLWSVKPCARPENA